ncbi:MAG: hypothetical protein AAGJ95_15600 [Cyanobacteria bacterium J06554_11]
MSQITTYLPRSAPWHRRRLELRWPIKDAARAIVDMVVTMISHKFERLSRKDVETIPF